LVQPKPSQFGQTTLGVSLKPGIAGAKRAPSGIAPAKVAQMMLATPHEGHGLVARTGMLQHVGWTNDARDALLAGRSPTVRPRGGSMRGRIEDGEEVTLDPVAPSDVRVGDVVFVKWHGSFLLHLVKEATPEAVLIGNNVGKINGWVPRKDVVGRARGR
jgi:hypothetical protein